MGSQNDDQLSQMELVETKEEYPKKAKITYSRELLLSQSELDICRKLPSGFDPTVLSEFEEAASSIPERSKIPGALTSKYFRRGESESYPPTKGDSSNISRGNDGRWKNRFFVLNDRNSDSRLDLESDFGKHYGSQSTWRNPENDGLLGSGFFPKPSGFTSASVAKVQGSGQYLLSKSNEPYQPPRPYKAAPYSRKDVTDMINEETFGSSESSSQDRAEEEKERRASFEQFRKEQKAIHETQKQFPDKHKENVDPDFTALDDKKLWDKNIKLEDTTPKYLQEDLAAHTFASRPHAPPGFTGVTQEKKLGPRSVNSHSTVEVGNGGVHEQNVQIESNATENGTSKSLVDEKSLRRVDPGEKQYEIKTYHTPLMDISEKSVMGGIASPECATSILENLFSKASIVDSGFSNVSKPGDVDADTGSSIPFQSSKFPDWYPQEEKRQENEFSSGKPEELRSSIVNGEKDGSQVSRVSDQKTSILPLGSSDLIHKSRTATSCTLAILEPPYQSENSGASLGVLTCEDLEQSILSGFSDNSSPLDQSLESSKGLDVKAEKRPKVENHASQDLLSLLQKGTSVDDFVHSPIHEPLKNHVYESGSVNSNYNSTVEDFEGVETDPTLEALLGKAFMKELQSVKEPVSGQRGSVGGITHTHVLDSQGFPFPVRDVGFSNLTSSQTTLPDEKMCLGFGSSQGKVVPNYSTISAHDRADEALGIQLPDEESLITFCDAVGNTSNADLLSSSCTSIDIVDRIRGLNAALRKERSSVPVFDDPSVLRGSHKPRDTEFPYQNRHEQPSSQFAHVQMTHGRTSFQPSDFHPPCMNIPSKIMGLENILPHEFSQPNFQPPFQHVNNAPTRFCPPAQHPMLQQMQMQGNMLHPHLLRGLPRGPPAPPYAINPMSGFAPEPNTMQSLHFHHQQNYSGLEMPIQGLAVGGARHNHPEAFGKRTEMERRAKFRNINPVAGANRGRGIDMGFRYR